jgi:hypothetical protein
MDRILHSLARLFYRVITLLKWIIQYPCKAPVDYSRNMQFPNNAQIEDPARHGSGCSSLLLYLFQLGSGPRHSSFAWRRSPIAHPMLSSPEVCSRLQQTLSDPQQQQSGVIHSVGPMYPNWPVVPPDSLSILHLAYVAKQGVIGIRDTGQQNTLGASIRDTLRLANLVPRVHHLRYGPMRHRSTMCRQPMRHRSAMCRQTRRAATAALSPAAANDATVSSAASCDGFRS